MQRLGLAVVVGIILFFGAPAPALAQDDAAQIVMGVYYRCTQGQEARADEIYNQVVAPVVQKQIDNGSFTGQLWLAHREGGPWRRVFATLGSDLNTMLDAQDAFIEELSTDHAAEMAELQTICSSHDDYFWTGIETSSVGAVDAATVGGATISAYHSCDMSREARADEIFTELLAPLYQKHMDMGHLTSWGFYGHRMGGIFRRLETMGGADHKTLLAMQDAIYTEANETDAAALTEFRSICTWHADYMWNNASQQ